jgi:small conductance mechanosensitive channel
MDSTEQITNTISDIFHNIFNSRTILIVVAVIICTVLIIKLISVAANWISKIIVDRLEKDDKERQTAYKRTETWVNVITAAFKLLIIVLAFYITWRLLSPASAPIAVVGASALFIVIASGTVGPLLRDFTVGSVMIAEKWYGVGDYIKVEPFSDIQGVVERLTLRSTKIRTLKGEVVWVHNQNIQGVKVKYRGLSSIALDVFVRDKINATKLLEDIIEIAPKGAMLIAEGLKITETEQLNDSMWRIEIIGQTVPGREWLIENFLTEAIQEADEQHESKNKIIVYGPIARYIDRVAEKRFKRAIK